MRRLIVLVSFGLILFGFRGLSQEMKIATYNIRVDIAFDTVNSWDKRKEALTSLLRFYGPDIFGTQEGLVHQLQYIKEGLIKYSYVGGGRTDGKTKGEYTAIFFNNDRFEALSDSTFWLSPTPDKPSRGWDAAYDRICTYVLLKDRLTNKKIWVFNSHLDNIGAQARINGVELIMTRMREVMQGKDYPVFFMGDFNCEEGDEAIRHVKSVLTDTKTISESRSYGPAGTFNDFDINSKLQRRIDFIFATPEKVIVHKYGVIDDRFGFKYPSDHLPVIVELEIK